MKALKSFHAIFEYVHAHYKLDNKIRQNTVSVPSAIITSTSHIAVRMCDRPERIQTRSFFRRSTPGWLWSPCGARTLCLCRTYPWGSRCNGPCHPSRQGAPPSPRRARTRVSVERPWKKKDAVAILVQARQLALQIIIEMNEYLKYAYGLKKDFSSPLYIYTHNDFFDLTNRGRLPSFLKRTNYYSIFD